MLPATKLPVTSPLLPPNRLCREVKQEYLESVDGMVGNYEFAIEEKKQELGVRAAGRIWLNV